MVEVSVGGRGQLQGAEADVVQGLQRHGTKLVIDLPFGEDPSKNMDKFCPNKEQKGY